MTRARPRDASRRRGAARRARRRARGVTLLELLIVLSIMAIVAAIVVPMFGGGVSTAELQERGAPGRGGAAPRAQRGARDAAGDARRARPRAADVPGRARRRASTRCREQIELKLFTAQSDLVERQGRRDPLLSRRRHQRRPRHARRRRAQVRRRRRLADRPRRDPRLTRPTRRDAPRPTRDCAARAPVARARGFSLLEVLVAFVILSLVGDRAVPALLRRARATRRRPTTTAARCSSPRARSPRPRRRSRCARRRERGTADDGRIEWTTRVAPYVAAGRASPISSARPETLPTRLYRVTVGSDVSRRRPAASARSRSRRRASAAQGRAMTRARRACGAGFTLIELIDRARAAGAACRAMLFGSLSLAGAQLGRRRGEGRQVSDMRAGAGVSCARSSPRSIRSGCGRSPSCRCCSAASATRSATPRRCPRACRRRRLLLPARASCATATSRSSCRSA